VRGHDVISAHVGVTSSEHVDTDDEHVDTDDEHVDTDERAGSRWCPSPHGRRPTEPALRRASRRTPSKRLTSTHPRPGRAL
jgi:hypothetical protein